ncbi:MAG: metal-dependent hydrolase [Betaproteobacteria bacterium]|nr:metal-dependent hydrolase [Betaproteobacteria bacterium]
MRRSIKPLAVAGAVLLFSASAALAQQIEVLWLGHSTFRITSASGKVIVIDPFVTKNPRTPSKYKNLKAIGKADLILVTHGHGDHVGDLVELAKMGGSTVVANFELANNLVALGLIDGSKTIAMNKGGTVAPLGAGIKVHMVQAEHTADTDLRWMKPEVTERREIAGGVAVGYVIELENGFKIYHTGDTDVFGDMALIHKFHKPDLALVCIGGHFTMDPERAAYAVRELIRPKQVIAMHYGTYPVINRTPAELKAALASTPIKVLDMKPGDSVRF